MKKLVLILLIIMTSKIGFGQKISYQKDDTDYSPKEDYWKFSEQLFSFLSTKSSPNNSTTFYLTSHYHEDNNSKKAEFLHTGPYQIIKYRVKLKPVKSYKTKVDTLFSKFIWRVWDCNDGNTKIDKLNLIETEMLNINYRTAHYDLNKHKKKETYQVSYGKTKLIIEISCIKNFRLYRKELISDTFINEVFDVVNYYDNLYGCVEIVETN